MFTGYCGMGADVPRDMYYRKLPVWFGGNVYFNDADRRLDVLCK